MTLRFPSPDPASSLSSRSFSTRYSTRLSNWVDLECLVQLQTHTSAQKLTPLHPSTLPLVFTPLLPHHFNWSHFASHCQFQNFSIILTSLRLSRVRRWPWPSWQSSVAWEGQVQRQWARGGLITRQLVRCSLGCNLEQLLSSFRALLLCCL